MARCVIDVSRRITVGDNDQDVAASINVSGLVKRLLALQFPAPERPGQVMTKEEAGAKPARSRHCNREATLHSATAHEPKSRRGATIREPGHSRHRDLLFGADFPERGGPSTMRFTAPSLCPIATSGVSGPDDSFTVHACRLP